MCSTVTSRHQWTRSHKEGLRRNVEGYQLLSYVQHTAEISVSDLLPVFKEKLLTAQSPGKKSDLWFMLKDCESQSTKINTVGLQLAGNEVQKWEHQLWICMDSSLVHRYLNRTLFDLKSQTSRHCEY